jgi:mRNA interferase RelE/StbE
MALNMLVLVRDGKTRGRLLDGRVSTGDLSDCFMLYFDPDGSGKPWFRLVYRYTPTEVAAIAVEAVAVGRERTSTHIAARSPTSAGPRPPTPLT